MFDLPEINVPEEVSWGEQNDFQTENLIVKKEYKFEKGIEIDQKEVGEFIKSFPVSFEQVESIIEISEENPVIGEVLENALTKEVGKKYSNEIIRNKDYREQLKTLQDKISARLETTGPQLCKETSLKNLIAIQETVGERILNFMEAVNIKKLGEKYNFNAEYKETQIEALQTGVLKVEKFDINTETGEIETEIACDISFEIRDGITDEDDSVDIKHTFKREKNDQGITNKKVNLDLIRLPTFSQSNGLGADIMYRALNTYDSMGLNAITLEADIDVGCYAWQAYGYGWDLKKMTEGENYGPEEAIDQVVKKAKNNFLNALETSNLLNAEGQPAQDEHKQILREFELCEQNPLATTPQKLGNIGKEKSLFRAIVDATQEAAQNTTDEDLIISLPSFGNEKKPVKWVTEEEYSQLTTKEDHPNYPGKFHAGKMGFLARKNFSINPDSEKPNWYGVVDLNNEDQRKIYTQALKNRIKK